MRFREPPAAARAYLFRFPGDGTAAPATTDNLLVKVREAVAATAQPATVRHGTPMRVTGRVVPAAPGEIVLDRLLGRHAWRFVARSHVRTSGRYDIPFTLPAQGRYALRVTSGIKNITITRGYPVAVTVPGTAITTLRVT